MTVSRFNDLDEAEQAEAIWEGKHVGDRQDEEHNILLYKVENIYVEVYVHKQHQVIRKFHAFENEALLDLYSFNINN